MTEVRLDPQQVLSLIDGGRDDELVGAFETEMVDFKGQYRLAEASEKWELAKDIAAFANSGGGLIAIGFTTRVDDDRAEEVVEAVRPLPTELFVPKQVHDIAQQWVYPPPNIRVVRHPQGSQCLGTIEVVPNESDVPYLVTRMPDNSGRMVAQVAFGWPVRTGTQTMWTPVGQIHRHLRPATSVPSTAREDSQARDREVDWGTLVGGLELEMGWSDRAVLFLGAAPPADSPRQLADFYSENGVLGAAQRPFALRGAGFGLTYGHRVDTDKEGRIVSAEEERAFAVSRDGTALAALAAAPGFLTRGGGSRSPSEPEARRMNPVVVTEWSYLFCHFVAKVLAPRAPGEWALTVGLRGSRTRPWALRANGGRWDSKSDLWFLDGSESRIDSWEDSVRASLDPARDAYALISALYTVFGLDYDEVGFSADDAVDVDQIRALS